MPITIKKWVAWVDYHDHVQTAELNVVDTGKTYRLPHREKYVDYRVVVPKSDNILFDSELDAVRALRDRYVVRINRLRNQLEKELIIQDKILGFVKVVEESGH